MDEKDMIESEELIGEVIDNTVDLMTETADSPANCNYQVRYGEKAMEEISRVDSLGDTDQEDGGRSIGEEEATTSSTPNSQADGSSLEDIVDKTVTNTNGLLDNTQSEAESCGGEANTSTLITPQLTPEKPQVQPETPKPTPEKAQVQLETQPQAQSKTEVQPEPQVQPECEVERKDEDKRSPERKVEKEVKQEKQETNGAVETVRVPAKTPRELRSILELSKEARLETNLSNRRKTLGGGEKNDKTELGKRPRSRDVPDSDLESKLDTPSPSKKAKKLELKTSDFANSKTLAMRDIKGLKPDKDKFCWRCHHANVDICCETCPRSYHEKCLRQIVTDHEHWPCPECVAILKAENTETRSQAMKEMSLEHLCSLLKYAVKRMIDCSGSAPFLQPVDEKQVPDYRKYIINPMDLTMLEKNIKNNLYGSTQAFEADAKWILHNSVIFNSCKDVFSTNATNERIKQTILDQSRLTGTAKILIRICKQEMSEIENCASCYLNANTRRRTWFTEVCPRPHLLVWAKLKGFPYWPAKVMSVNSAGMVDVRFFGAHDRSWVHIKDCLLYSNKDPNSTKQKQKEISKCCKELDGYVENLRKIYGKVCMAPFRTPLLPDYEKQIRILLPAYTEKGTQEIFNMFEKKLQNPDNQEELGAEEESEEESESEGGEEEEEEDEDEGHMSCDLNVPNKEEAEKIGKESSILRKNVTKRKRLLGVSPGQHIRKLRKKDYDDNLKALDDDSNKNNVHDIIDKEKISPSKLKITPELIKKFETINKMIDNVEVNKKSETDKNEENQKFNGNQEKEKGTNVEQNKNTEDAEKEKETDKAENAGDKDKQQEPKGVIGVFTLVAIKDILEKKHDNDEDKQNENNKPEENKQKTSKPQSTIKQENEDLFVNDTKYMEAKRQLLSALNISEKSTAPPKNKINEIRTRSKTEEKKSRNSDQMNDVIEKSQQQNNKSDSNERPGEIFIKPLSKMQAPKPKARKTFPMPNYTMKKLPIAPNPIQPKKIVVSKIVTPTTNFLMPRLQVASGAVTNTTNTIKIVPHVGGLVGQQLPIITTTQNIQTLPNYHTIQNLQNLNLQSLQNAQTVLNKESPLIPIDVNTPANNDRPAEAENDFTQLGKLLPENARQSIQDIFNVEQGVKKPLGILSANLEPAMPSTAGPVTTSINNVAETLATYFKHLLIETIEDIGKTPILSPDSTIGSLRLELEELNHKHNTEINEMKRNVSIVLKDIQKCVVEERERVIAETRANYEMEMMKKVQETKTKQWCANCWKEAHLRCCWNTSYCDYPCQQKHWQTHKNKCEQSCPPTTQTTVAVPNSSTQLVLAPGQTQKFATLFPKAQRVYIKRPTTTNILKPNTPAGHITIVESTPGNYELVGNGPLTLNGKIISTSALEKMKAGNVTVTSPSLRPSACLNATDVSRLVKKPTTPIAPKNPNSEANT